LRGIVKQFPGVVANDHVDFEALEGEIHALLGENGAGKSTLSNIMTGLYRPDEGEIRIHGGVVEFRSPRDALAAGIGMVHQHFRLAASFTVAENFALGAQAGGGFLLEATAIEDRVAELADRYRMPVNPRARVWQLSVGERQRVEILKALYRGARILILDEPTSLLTPQEAENLFGTLRLMSAEGRTVIFISHKLEEVMAVSDRVTVLRGGKSLGTVLTQATTPRELARLMVGRDVVFSQKAAGHTVGQAVLLELRGIEAETDMGTLALRGIDLQLHAGEILGVAGVAGNGQRELAEVITGMRACVAGSLLVSGKAVRGHDPRQAIELGIAHVPEDRLGTGVAPSLSIADNLILKEYRRPPASTLGVIRYDRVRARADDLIRRFDIRAVSPQTPTRLLSGGNVQKVLLARELSGSPKVLVAASPTRGLDVAATEAVRAVLLEAAAQGVGILLISEDLDEILALADRVAVLYEGRVMGVVPRRDAHVEELGLLMAGSVR
jgi:simple sugar transport system ATP-binding protein